MTQFADAFRADLTALEELVGRLADFDRQAGAVAAGLEQDMHRLDGQWSGTAAQAHAAAHHDWADAHERLRRAAAELHELVRCAHENYADASRANITMWR